MVEDSINMHEYFVIVYLQLFLSMVSADEAPDPSGNFPLGPAEGLSIVTQTPS